MIIKLHHIQRALAVISLVALLATQSAHAQSRPEATLKVGDPAPTVSVEGWAQGTPVAQFEKGKVYVLEFWATWCGPCFQAMPHLSELSKKYAGKVVFTGVDVWEDVHGSDGIAPSVKVEKFLKDNPGRMSYNVAVDGKAGLMASHWLQAAGQNGIPASFVVDQDGKIAWIGHPEGGLETVVGQVVEGKFDPKAFAEERRKKREALQTADAPNRALLKPIQDAIQSKDYKAALALCAKVEVDHPALKPRVAQLKLSAAMNGDEGVMLDMIQQAIDSKSLTDLARYGQTIAMTDGLTKATYSLGAKSLIAFGDAQKDDKMAVSIHYLIGLACFKAGDMDKAVENTEKARKEAEDTSAPAETMKAITDALAKYKAAAAKGGK
ncbi:MAG TPA: TlpA disulfide reductase family protein [Fimbriimonadaceae bacterium]|jgi:thiol-disulfide isomerase/thioredoxin